MLGFLRRLFGGSAETAPVFDPLLGVTDAASYRVTLASILKEHADAAVQTLRAAFAQMPDKAQSLVIMVHPSQEPDGTFSVLLHPEGPDIFVLNKALEPHRTLFSVKSTPTGVVPRVPLFDIFDTPFSVNDVIVDVAADWIETVWTRAGGAQFDRPAAIAGEDGHGETMPRSLPSGAKG